ncbi:MAG: hypothetical protein H0X03_08600 [Nitrosopumilus sp.]|nr:hypothetical protein [Nitrosopumilus sp.]
MEKTFNVSTQKCITIDKPTQIGEPCSESSFIIPGINSTLYKEYEYDSTHTVHTVKLTISIELR